MSSTVLNRHAPTLQQGRHDGLWSGIWAAFERHGQRRAASELRRQADLQAFCHPDLARGMRDAADRADRAALTGHAARA